MRKRVGDTLIEVTLAIGIFSMVAIAVVAVMNGGTTGSQAALESTLAREEIDTQAETLRFIQSAFVADKDSGIDDNVYNGLWGEISDLAIDLDSEEQKRLFDSIINNTTSCENVYGTEFFKNHAFFIDPNDMNIITDKNSMADNRLVPATTYPRLLSDNPSGQPQTLLEDGDVSSGGNLKAEGIYILAVKDDKTTTITDADNQSTKEKSAFYDFYVRSCWYGAGEDAPSTISTIVRLYNPSATVVASEATGIWVEFNPNNVAGLTESQGSTESVFISVDGSEPLTKNGFYRGEFYDDAYTFMGWNTDPNATSPDYRDEAQYRAPSHMAFNDKATLYAIWKSNYHINYHNKDGSIRKTVDCDKYKGCNLSIEPPTSSGLKFQGWCVVGQGETPPAIITGCSNEKQYTRGEHFPKSGILNQQAIELYPVWKYVYKLTYHNTNGRDVIRQKEIETTSSTYPFLIDSDLSPIAPSVSENGNEMVLLGWSENKNGSGNIYSSTGNDGTLRSLVATGVTHADIHLYPVWREIITFSNVPWDNFGTTSYCTINKNNSGIELRGNRSSAVNCGVQFAVNKDDTFELSANLNTSGIFTHPTGLVAVSVGPLVAIITTGGSGLIIYYGYLPLSSSVTSSDISSASNYTRLAQKNITNNGTVTLKLTKYEGVYTMSVDGYEVKIETRENGNGTYNVLKSDGTRLASSRSSNELNNLKVKYTMIHTSHNCSTIFNAKLYNIKMTKSDIYYER